MEGDCDGRNTCICCAIEEAPEHLLMAEMNAIEVAEGDRAPRPLFAFTTQVADDLHDCHPLHQRRRCAGAPGQTALTLLSQFLELSLTDFGFFGLGMIADQLLQDEARVDLVAGVGECGRQRQQGARHLVALWILQ